MADPYVILTHKDGQFHTEFDAALEAVEQHDYLFCGKRRARFVIARLLRPARVALVETAPPHLRNLVPSKFLPHFDSLDHARAELRQLVAFGTLDTQLVAVPLAAEKASAPRKEGMVQITLLSNAGKVLEAPQNSNLLRASLRGQGGIPFKCGGGICGTCKCRIEAGLAHTDAVKPKERKHLSEDDLLAGFRMACQTFVHGDVSVSW